MAFELTVRGDSPEDLRRGIAQLASLMLGSSEQPVPGAETSPEAAPAKATRSRKASADAKPTEPEPEPETPPAVTMDDVRAAVQRLVDCDPRGAKKAVGIMVELKAFNDKGEPRAANLAENKFAECIALCEAAIAEFEANPVGVL